MTSARARRRASVNRARLRAMKQQGDRPHADAFWRLYLRYVYQNEKRGKDARTARAGAVFEIIAKTVHIVVWTIEEVSQTKEVARKITAHVLGHVEEDVTRDVLALMRHARAIELPELVLKLSEKETNKSDDELVDDFFRTVSLTLGENIKEARQLKPPPDEHSAFLLGLEETAVELCAVCVLIVTQLFDHESRDSLKETLHVMFDALRVDAECLEDEDPEGKRT